MSTPDGDRESIVRRLHGSQRVLVVALLVVLVVGGVGVAAGFSVINPFNFGYAEDFEDGERGEWSGGAIVEDSYQETYSLSAGGGVATLSDTGISITGGQTTTVRMLVLESGGISGDIELGGPEEYLGISYSLDYLDLDYNDGSGPEKIDSTTMDLDDEWHNVEWETNSTYTKLWVWDPGQSKPSDPTLEGSHTGVDLSDPSMLLYQTNTDIQLDEIGIDAVPPTGVSGTVTDDDGNELSGVTVEAEQGGAVVDNATTDDFGQYELPLDNGTYDVTASKDGYLPETETVTVDGDEVTQDFQLRNRSAALQIDARLYVEHGQTVPYSIVFENGTDATGLTREDVTDEATLVSGGTGVLTVNNFDHEMTGTSDTSVNNRTYIEAEYSEGGETYTTRQNVTVANETVENLGILPPVSRFSASITDTNMQVIIIAAATGAAASIIATAFAGVAAMTMVMMMGWIAGYVGNGMAMVTVFIALFVGLNVAGNVDYTVRR